MSSGIWTRPPLRAWKREDSSGSAHARPNSAGNDQIRFDAALRVLADGIELLAPVRENGLTRDYMATYLRQRGHHIGGEKAAYSINKSLWGTTIGGKETHTTHLPLFEEAYLDTVAASVAPAEGRALTLAFEQGVSAGW